jgi:uncharacterized protein (TIGR02270 family)
MIVAIVAQHADELAGLWNTRRVLSTGGHTGLRTLGVLDERIAAHLDGCVVAGEEGLRLLQDQAIDPNASTAFALGAAALDMEAHSAFEHAVEIAELAPRSSEGLASALGWVASTRLVGVVQKLLDAQSPTCRSLGLAACRMHGVNPGVTLDAALGDSRAEVVVEGLRLVAAIGAMDAFPAVRSLVEHEDPTVAMHAAAAAVLLGDRTGALDRLRTAVTNGLTRREVLELTVQGGDVASARSLLSDLTRRQTAIRQVIIGTGASGDARYIPWLIARMREVKHGRVAGEAFSTITGVDLLDRLDRSPPEDFGSDGDEDPDAANVAMDEDDGLPWPDVERVAHSWQANGSRLQVGTRYFMGAPVTREHCIDVLKNGYQRQRMLAAHYLCLLNPGTPLFNTSAPAWRQQRLLSEMK